MELAKKSDKELVKLLAKKREELREFRFNMASQGNVRKGRSLRKDVARILTEKRARELQGEQKKR